MGLPSSGTRTRAPRLARQASQNRPRGETTWVIPVRKQLGCPDDARTCCARARRNRRCRPCGLPSSMRLLARARGRRGLYPARCGGTSEAAMIPGPTGPTGAGRQTLLAHPLSSTRPAQALGVGAHLGHTRSSTDCEQRETRTVRGSRPGQADVPEDLVMRRSRAGVFRRTAGYPQDSVYHCPYTVNDLLAAETHLPAMPA